MDERTEVEADLSDADMVDVLRTVISELRSFASQSSARWYREELDRSGKDRWVAKGRKEGFDIMINRIDRATEGLMD